MSNYHQLTSKQSKLWVIITVLALIALTQQSNFYPQKASYWGSYQFKVAYTNGTNIAGTTPFLYYSVPFTSGVTNILDMAVVLSSYQMAAFPNMLFRVTKPTYSSTLTSASFGIQVVSPSSFTYLRFFVVYNTQLSAAFFEINVLNTTCTTANGAIGTSKTQVMTSATRLSVGGGDTVTVNPVLSSIMLYNSNQPIDFRFTTTATPISSNTLSVSLITSASITEIIVTTFILKTNLVPNEDVFYTNTISIPRTSGSLSALCTANFNIPTKNGPSLFNRNCSLAVSSLADDNLGILRNINIDATVSGAPAFSSCQNSAETAVSGTMTIGYTVFCSYEAVCMNSSEYYDPSNTAGNICFACNTLNALCTTCRKTSCITCTTGYYPDNSGPINCNTCTQANCTTCLSINTCGQCTNSSFLNNSQCVSCTLVNHCVLCTTSTNCLSCVNGFGPDPTGICQLCNAMMPQCAICQSYYQCSQCNTNYYVSPGGSSCISCSYNVSNCGTCINSFNCTGCLTGYFLANSSSCISCPQTVPHCGVCFNNGTCNQCSAGYYFSSPNCLACTITGCYNCTGPTVCVTCNLGYFINSSFLCTACSDPHCASCNTSSFCQQCESDYILSANGSSCICSAGFWVITDVCTSVIGCVSATKISNVSTCLFCDSLSNFIISGTTCVCKTGYKFINNQCFTVCGDGLTIAPEICDDGNTVSGDGCSSTCTAEDNYVCAWNNAVYKCVFTSSFSIVLDYIYRHQTDNSATYFFTIQPTSPNFQKVNLLNQFKLSIPSLNYTPTAVAYSQGTVSIDVTFTKDIQNLPATLYLDFDPTYFNSNNFTYSFLSTGTNQPLIISNYGTQLAYLKIACYVILGFAALILVLSSAFEKMIGIETINIIQIIVFSKLLYVQNDLLISGEIITMKYIAGYNEIGKNLQHTHEVPLTYRRLSFNSDYILNFQTGLIMMVLSIIIYGLLQLYKKRSLHVLSKTKKGSIDEFKLVEQKFQEKEKFIYERIVLIVACINLFDCMAAVRLQSRILDSERHYTYFLLNLTTMLFSLFYIFSVLAYQVLNIGKEHTWQAHFCSYSRYYLGYYICYIFLVTPIIIGGEQFVEIEAIFMLSGLVLGNLIILIIWMPYQQLFHNFSVIFNNVVLLFVLGISATMKIINLDENIELIFACILLGLLFLVECLAMVRIYMAAKAKPKENQRLRLNEGDDDINKGFETIQKEFLNNPQKKIKHPISKMKSDESELVKLRSRLKKQFVAKHLQEAYQL